MFFDEVRDQLLNQNNTKDKLILLYSLILMYSLIFMFSGLNDKRNFSNLFCS